MAKSPVNKYYFDKPEIWEEVSRNRFEEESKFLVEIFRRYGKVKNILDVGCGTGSHLNKLSKHGFVCEGIDLNKNMIGFAKKQYPHIKFEVGDMKKLKYSNKFDAIICLCTTFCYNTSNEDVVEALNSFYKSLRKGGLLVLETFNSISFIEKIKFEKKIEKIDYGKFGIRSIEENSINPNKQLLIEKRTFISSNGKRLKTDLTKYRMFFPQEMRFFLESAGFKLLGFYGGYQTKHKNLDGFRLITVSKK